MENATQDAKRTVYGAHHTSLALPICGETRNIFACNFVQLHASQRFAAKDCPNSNAVKVAPRFQRRFLKR
jgi:hypothetical protein